MGQLYLAKNDHADEVFWPNAFSARRRAAIDLRFQSRLDADGPHPVRDAPGIEPTFVLTCFFFFWLIVGKL